MHTIQNEESLLLSSGELYYIDHRLCRERKSALQKNYQIVLNTEIYVFEPRKYQKADFPGFLEPTRKIGSSFLLYYSVFIYNHVTERFLSDEREVLNNFCSDSQ